MNGIPTTLSPFDLVEGVFIPNLIDGRWRPAQAGAEARSHDPSDGSLTARYADGDDEDACAAVEAAEQAFVSTSWASDARTRQSVLLEWADRMERDAPALAAILTAVNGKVLPQAAGEIASAISEIRYYAGLARDPRGNAMEVAPGEFSVLLREPAGVAAIIVPWNAPAALLVRSLAPAVAAGCATVVKPASQTALLTARMIAHLAASTGLPRGIVNLVHESGSKAARHLVESHKVDVVSFTGSTETGTRIMAAAAPSLKKLSLELGDKSAALVMADADIADVASKLAAAATIISGQQCTAARRVLVHASRHAEMAEALTAALADVRIGNGRDPRVGMGPLIDRQARDRVLAESERAFDLADKVLLRGTVPAGCPEAGAFLSPSLVQHEDSSSALIQEEIFGPFVVLERFETEAEAVARLNHTYYGLAASVWTLNGAAAWRLARAARRGTVWINDHNRLFAEAETGGYRRAGIGRLHGREGLVDFTELKHIYQAVGTL